MPPSTMRGHLKGHLGWYEAQNIARIDSHLRDLRVRRLDGGPQLPRVWADIDALLDLRWSMMDKAKRHLPAVSGKIKPRK